MAKKYELEIDINTGKAIGGVQDLGSELQAFNDSVQKTSEQTALSVKNIEKASDDSAKGVRKLSAGIKASIIGIAIAAFAALKNMVTENQKALDFFNTAFEVGAIAISDLINFLSANYDKATGFFKDVFENPGEYVKKLGQLIKDNIIERFNSALEVGGYLADALKKLFTGDFNGAIDSVKNAGIEMLDVMSGIDNSFEKAKEGIENVSNAISEYAKETYNAAAANVELQKQSELALITNQGLIEKYDRQAERQRQIRDDERNSIEERIQANKDLGATLDEQEKLMQANAAIALQAAKIQYDRDQNNVEAKKAYLEALNEQQAIEAQIEGFRSEQLTNEMSLERERLDLVKSRLEANEDLALSQKLFNAEQIKDEVARQEALNEIYASEDAAKLARLKSDIELYNQDTQARVDAEIAYEQFKEEARQREVENEQLLADKKLAIEARDIEVKKENAETLAEIETQKRADQMATLDNAISIANEESALGKALLIAKQILAAREAIIDAQASARKAASAVTNATVDAAGAGVAIAKGTAETAKVGFPQNIPLLVAYAAQAVGIITAIRSATQKVKGAGAPSIGSVASAPSLPQAVAPQINTVGSSGVNQIADAINQRPVKAYVVSGDVTTAQQLDRNIIKEAGI